MADYYHTLGVSRGASDAEIKTAYRKQAMTYHPDRNNGAKEAEEKFKAITEAYDVLRDPNKRALYDRYGEAGLRGGASGFHHVDLSEARVGGLGTDLVASFLHELAEGGGLTLHVRLIDGDDPQHVLEAIFKALGVALAQAGRPRKRRD